DRVAAARPVRAARRTHRPQPPALVRGDGCGPGPGTSPGRPASDRQAQAAVPAARSPPPAGQLAPRAPASRGARGRAHLPGVRPDARRYRHGPERTTRLSAGVAVRGRTLRPQNCLPLLQPAPGISPGTASTPGPGVRAYAVAGTRPPTRAALGASDPRAGRPRPAGHRPGPTAAGAGATIPDPRPGRGGDRRAEAGDADRQGIAGAWPAGAPDRQQVHRPHAAAPAATGLRAAGLLLAPLYAL